jgi:transposase
VDECGVNTHLQREYGRAPCGKAVEDVKRGKRHERINIIGARCNGEYSSIECYNHTTNSIFFERWFKEKLLSVIPGGYTIIMDNAKYHRKEELRKLARGNVRILFLPPYSPDYNPIEQTWANMKRFLRNNMKDYQSVNSGIYSYFRITGS